jgi:preprotein translocase subunit SecY
MQVLFAKKMKKAGARIPSLKRERKNLRRVFRRNCLQIAQKTAGPVCIGSAAI